MNLAFNTNLSEEYTNPSQKIRVLTEDWVDNQIFCPNCGQVSIDKYENNRPVADFYCSNCKEEYELKSKRGSIGSKIVDGAYSTMIERLQSANNPNFFFLNYNQKDFSVQNFLVIPKHFFVPEIIEKRKALSPTARRAGWVGCNIMLSDIPQSGRIFFVRDGQMESKDDVVSNWKKTLFLREEKEFQAKGWLLDIMHCVDKVGAQEFSLDDVYAFEGLLSKKHPNNKHIKDKIRQQLQFLRDRDYLEFIERGKYRLK